MRLLQRAVESSASGIAIADMQQDDFPLIYVNPAFEKLTGYKSKEVLGKNCRFLQGKERDQDVRKKIKKALLEGKEGRFVVKNFRKDGTLFWNELVLAPVRDSAGKVTHFIGIQQDVTWREKG
jgi:PAS domain S-box-containing protein